MSIRWAKRRISVDDFQLLLREGFDCALLPAGIVMDGADDGGFRREKERMLASGISFEVFESPLPKGVQVTERGFNYYSWTEYLKTELGRLSELGCRTLVWGDGRARILPLEGETTSHKESFNQFVFMLCDLAERFGITFCIEPLGARRTNYLNDLKGTADFFSMIGKRNLSMALSPRDLFEMEVDTKELSAYAGTIGHVHLENPGIANASVPPRSSDGYDYPGFFRELRKAGYEGVVSLPPDADADTLSWCRKIWEETVR